MIMLHLFIYVTITYRYIHFCILYRFRLERCNVCIEFQKCVDILIEHRYGRPGLVATVLVFCIKTKHEKKMHEVNTVLNLENLVKQKLCHLEVE